MIGFEDYAKICNNYCVCYFGYNNEYLVQLQLLRPCLERRFPGLNIYIGCKDESISILDNEPKLIKISELKSRKQDFAHINELRFNGSEHPVQAFLEKAELSEYTVPIKQKEITTRCIILTRSFHPTKDLTSTQIKELTEIAKRANFEVELDASVENSGLVMGVEHPSLFKAASWGIETMLVPTGVGTHLYKKMFPNGKIL